MIEPYRSFDMCERHRDDHGSPVAVQVVRRGAWRWGPFAGGTVRWGDLEYRVFGTSWFSIWFGPKAALSVSAECTCSTSSPDPKLHHDGWCAIRKAGQKGSAER